MSSETGEGTLSLQCLDTIEGDQPFRHFQSPSPMSLIHQLGDFAAGYLFKRPPDGLYQCINQSISFLGAVDHHFGKQRTSQISNSSPCFVLVLAMDHQMLTESYGNHAHGRDLPVDMLGSLERTKLEKGWGSYYQDDYEQYKDERSLGCFSDHGRQQTPLGSKRVPRNSGSGMQPVFLHGSHPHSHSSKGSVGTGVFLPPGTGSMKKPTKKSGCSTVLLPAGVIQALKLHFDRVDRQSLSNSTTKPCSCCHRTPLQQDAMINNRNGYDNAKQRLRFQIAAALWSQESIRDEEGLPQEWTY